jgi:replication factor A2
LQVVVVGAVVEINKQATNTVYKLDDGTGRIEARHWAVSSPDVEDEPANRVGDIVQVAILLVYVFGHFLIRETGRARATLA